MAHDQVVLNRKYLEEIKYKGELFMKNISWGLNYQTELFLNSYKKKI